MPYLPCIRAQLTFDGIGISNGVWNIILSNWTCVKKTTFCTRRSFLFLVLYFGMANHSMNIFCRPRSLFYGDERTSPPTKSYRIYHFLSLFLTLMLGYCVELFLETLSGVISATKGCPLLSILDRAKSSGFKSSKVFTHQSTRFFPQ